MDRFLTETSRVMVTALSYCTLGAAFGISLTTWFKEPWLGWLPITAYIVAALMVVVYWVHTRAYIRMQNAKVAQTRARIAEADADYARQLAEMKERQRAVMAEVLVHKVIVDGKAEQLRREALLKAAEEDSI